MAKKLVLCYAGLLLIACTVAEAQAPPSSLTLSPLGPTIAVRGTQAFTGTKGVAPYTFSIVRGSDSTGGAAITAAGMYTAGPTPGTTIVELTDSDTPPKKVVTLVTVTPPPALSLSPPSPTVAVRGTKTFMASGGVPPYTFSKLAWGDTTGGAAITAAGMYTAGPTPGTTIVELTDSDTPAKKVATLVTVTPLTPLTLSPLTPTVTVKKTHAFTATGGIAPYTFSKMPGSDTTGGATITAAGVYTAGPTSGTTMVQLTDSASPAPGIADTLVTVTPPPPLTLSPLTPTVTVKKTHAFTATGGIAPYTFSKVPGSDTTGGATITAAGVYTAGPTSGTTMVQLTDSATPPSTVHTPVTVTLSDVILESCKRDNNLAVYTNDLPSWRFGAGGNTLFSWLPNGEWTVGTAILSETIRYDFGKKKAAVFEGAGVGASFRFYRDIEDVGRNGTPLKLHQVKSECRASSLATANERTIATPMFSLTPAIFASKPLKDEEFRVEPAIMLGFFQDLINVGAGFNLTGDDGDVGDVFLLFSLGFGFNFGGSDTASQP